MKLHYSLEDLARKVANNSHVSLLKDKIFTIDALIHSSCLILRKCS